MIGGIVREQGAARGRPARGGRRVRLRLTVADPARAGAVADVEMSAAPGTPLAHVRGPLLAAVGWRGGTPGPGLFVDGERVDERPVGSPPLLAGAVVTVGRPGGATGRAAGTAGGAAEVHVVAGPDAGARHPLAPGVVRVGRGDGASLRLADPDVSRAHAEVEVAGGVVRVRDLGSTNGTRVDGVGLAPGPGACWPPGTEVQVGGTRLALRTPDADPGGGGGPAATHPDGEGHLLVNPAPRLLPPPVGGRVAFPEAPADPARPRLPWVAVVLPLLLSVPLAWWLRQVTLLAFALLSPVMLLAQHLVDRRDRRRDDARARAGRAAQTAAATAQLDALLAAERARLRVERLDPAAVGAVAAGPLQRLWERRRGDRDELVLRLGLGDVESAVEVHGSAPHGPGPPVLTDVPVALDLAGHQVGGVLGVAAPRSEGLALVRSLVGQAAVANSPRHLRIAVLAASVPAAAAWRWAAWLPHALGDLPATDPAATGVPATGVPADAGLPVTRPDGAATRVLLVLDGAASLRRDPRVAAFLAAAGDDLTAICLDDDEARLPAECGATVLLGGPDDASLAVRGKPRRTFRPDLVPAAWAERLGRDLARLADATPATAVAELPAEVHLADLLRAGGLPLSAGGIRHGWACQRAARAPATGAVVGVTRDGPWRVDLAVDGPHALVAGTTGSGKSELLVTLVAALAAAHPPDRLHLLLVDYKGGTAFGALGGLPHTAGVLTDLDPHLARRALASLRAELRRREGLLRAAGASDVDDYDRRRTATTRPLPRLTVVVDEFRVLSEELPELLTGLVRVAVVGRSLGVHLILATQRPAGVVTAEMRANVNLRIALRVRDALDSDDVVDSPAAASLPADRPGRGLARAGGGTPVEFQAARAGGPHRDAAPGATVHRVRPGERLVTRWRSEPTPGGAGPTGAVGGAGERPSDDLDRLVAACREAADAEGLPPAAPPWLPPLPELIRPAELPSLLTAGRVPAHTAGGDAPAGSPVPSRVAPPGTGDAPVELTFGLVDLPDTQARAPLVWRVPAEGHLAVVGAPGTGRTTVLRALTAAAGRSGRPVHVHVVDGGGCLAHLDGLPGVGTVVPVTDVERAGRLLARLAEQAHRSAQAPAGTPPGPVTLLLVDGWEPLLDTWLAVDHGRLVDDLVALARDATGNGFRLAITGGRSLLSGPLSGLLTERLLLRAADPADLVLAGVRARDLLARMPPGRALRPTPDDVVEAQVLFVEAARPVPRPGAGRVPEPLRLAPLPERLSLPDLLSAIDRAAIHLAGVDGAAVDGAAGDGTAPPVTVAAGMLPLGVGGDDAGPVGPPATGAGWLVAGRPRSGRSTALATAGQVLRAAGRTVVAVAAAGSPLARASPPLAIPVGPVRVVSPGEAVRAEGAVLLSLLDRHPEATLLVDDAGALADSGAEDALLARLADSGAGRRWPSGSGPHVLAATDPEHAALAYRGLVARLRSTGCGLLLGPVAPGDGEAFGVRAPTVPGSPPGRALVIRDGRALAVQLACPGP